MASLGDCHCVTTSAASRLDQCYLECPPGQGRVPVSAEALEKLTGEGPKNGLRLSARLGKK